MMERTFHELPAVRGSYTENAPLKDLVWFRAGGNAEMLFRPADAEDLAAFLKAKPQGLPVCTIGVGSNLLVRDGGILGVVIRLPASFGKITVEGTRIRAGAAALDANVARMAAEKGIAGLEFLRGIPGTIGGALRMNAGCYGDEIKDILVEATGLDAHGNTVTFTNKEMGFSYRKCEVPEDVIFIEAVFEGTRGVPHDIRARMNKLVEDREASQPIKTKTGGSTFKNPPDRKAWQLIDEAGCRGLKRGEAQVSEKHCNFLINTGDAKAVDIEALGEEVRARVKAKSGVMLEWEIRRVGIPEAAR